MSVYTVSELQKSDYYHGFLQLLEQLTTVCANEITYQAFSDQFDKFKSKVFVVKENGQVIGTAALLVEEKFIHKLASVGHIEDVVVSQEYRDKGIGKLLINHCVEYAKNNGCYKVILNCAEKNIEFYKKCGFTNKNVEMSIYLH
ncbi:glucosamine 6-phosphate N-acetyltransferase [Fadolivirus algeromassiliense]|jgi:glucosamine-phosphate N-acetyltransferase|uniref:glucosamine-phosphate N-acetyltransferase n=1 Tax=Fadolivirus FV1/VV64 TaxID=3070911 RepID=A0A7D3UQP6_9VIRU|nr:glucosamine 6-phosphate N-acetyltransferase [Fadolivirus algeromassiliense]QKF93973.1 glucosamine 6-phosphate N-acetyltransferase [Fadolivirus FV1/VV64]